MKEFKFKRIDEDSVKILSMEFMQEIYGGFDQSTGFQANCCNYFCQTDADCCSECPICESIGNWPGKTCTQSHW